MIVLKNVFQYYYKLTPETIHQINGDYRCKIDNDDYLLHKLGIMETEVHKLYGLHAQLLERGFLCHQIITNFNNEIITIINGESYILLKLFIFNRSISIEDINKFANLYVDQSQYKELDRSNWLYLWTTKVDYIEYQVGQFGKNYPLIRRSINYYIGLAETAISLISSIEKYSTYLVVAHRRIREKDKAIELYNPLSFVIDVRIRDLSEYYKEMFFIKELCLEELRNTILSYKLNSYEATLFYARLIFPTYYFDCYQEIVLGDKDEKEILKYTSKIEQYELFLKEIYFLLRQYYEIPEIDWLIKT